MTTRLELEEYLYRRAIDIIESADTDDEKEQLLYQEVWHPLTELYAEQIKAGMDADSVKKKKSDIGKKDKKAKRKQAKKKKKR
jgi:hypothetical protein